jgi:hypothetical protein
MRPDAPLIITVGPWKTSMNPPDRRDMPGMAVVPPEIRDLGNKRRNPIPRSQKIHRLKNV